MTHIPGIRRIFRMPWRSPRRIREEIDEELAFHLEMRAAELERERALTAGEARREAMRQFGDIERTRHYCEDNDRRAWRETRRAELLGELAQDARYAWRSYRKTPGFTLTAVATLALGIGANTAIFSVVNGVLLNPLPYAGADRLVRIFEQGERGRMPVSPLDLADWRERSASFSGIAGIVERSTVLTGQQLDAEQVSSAQVSANLFSMVATQPLIGRWLAPREDASPAAREVVLSEELWRRRYGGDAGLIGKDILLDRQPYTVVGVLPRGSGYPPGVELWTPLEVPPGLLYPGARLARFMRVLARLRDGVSVEQARADMAGIARQLAAEYPRQNTGVGTDVVALREQMLGDVRTPLLIVMGAVGLVMLIACANVANLLLARGASRETEITIRGALGASRGRLVRQLATESVLLAIVGGAAALLLARWGASELVRMAPSRIPRLDEVRLDGTVLLATLGISIVTGLLFGLIPALQGTRPDPTGALRSGRTGGARTPGRRLRSALVISEMALSLTLLAGAGLLVRTLANLQQVDPGFRPERLVTFTVSLPEAAYPNEERRRGFERALREELERMPGVSAVATTTGLPLSGASFALPFNVEERLPPAPGEQPVAQLRAVSPSFFATMGIPLVRGRALGASDRPGSPPVAVINEAAARRFFPGEDPLGKRIRFAYDIFLGGEIVGVVADVKQFGLDAETQPEAYLSSEQFPAGEMTAVMRVVSAPEAALTAARARVRALDPALPLTDARTVESLVSDSISQPRFLARLLATFALVAVVLASVGIWGVISYAVGRRTNEIGVRMALGATSDRVMRMVMREGLALTLAGASLGVLGALWATRLMRGLLFEVRPGDPLTLAGGAALLVAVSLLACYLPARRAARVDPLRAMRAD
jgi:predicted permease